MSDERVSHPLGAGVTLDDAVPRKSNYVTKQQCDPAILVQIARCVNDEVRNKTGGTDIVGVLEFNGEIKPLILNQINKDALKGIFQTNDPEALVNKHIILFNDKTVSYQGNIGAVRIRAAEQPAAVSHVPPPQPPYDPTDQEFDDKIPYT